MKSISSSPLKRSLCATAIVMVAWSSNCLAQNLPVPGDCGAFGNRACPIGAPAAPIGNPVGAAGMAVQGGAGAFGGAAGGAGAPGAPAAAVGFGAPPPENGFSWQQRTPDGDMQSCRRGLDGVTVRCEIPGQER